MPEADNIQRSPRARASLSCNLSCYKVAAYAVKPAAYGVKNKTTVLDTISCKSKSLLTQPQQDKIEQHKLQLLPPISCSPSREFTHKPQLLFIAISAIWIALLTPVTCRALVDYGRADYPLALSFRDK